MRPVLAQAQGTLLLRQCQRDEKVLYPLGEGENVHVPTHILWDTACRKIYERRLFFVQQLEQYREKYVAGPWEGAPPPVWRTMFNEEEIRGTLESARQAVQLLAGADI